jgi:hypothetical protein
MHRAMKRLAIGGACSMAALGLMAGTAGATTPTIGLPGPITLVNLPPLARVTVGSGLTVQVQIPAS